MELASVTADKVADPSTDSKYIASATPPSNVVSVTANPINKSVWSTSLIASFVPKYKS